jgi:hypothetical protein
MKRRHEFLAVSRVEAPWSTNPYCAVCSLPRGNDVHRARPRSFVVAVTTFSLDDPQRDCHYGPFGTEDDAQEFAAKLAGPHRTATVTELSDPAQVTTKK